MERELIYKVKVVMTIDDDLYDDSTDDLESFIEEVESRLEDIEIDEEAPEGWEVDTITANLEK